MILDCPLCHARYLLAASLFNNGPKQVRCARCSHGWMADLSQDVTPNPTPILETAVSEPELTPPPPSLPPIPAGSALPVIPPKPMPVWLKKVLLITGTALLGILLGWLIFDRQNLAKNSPSIENIYNGLGLHIFHVGEGLKIDEVHSELRYEGGITKLDVDGKIVNLTHKTLSIPDILVLAVGTTGSVIQGWQIDAPQATVAPNETVPFHSSINAPRGTVVEVNLDFTESKNDTD